MRVVYCALLLTLCLFASTSYQYSTDNVLEYLQALEDIAYTVGNGNRAADSPGYNASVDYVIEKLNQYKSNYTITQQPFSYSQFVINSPSELSQVTPEVIEYINGVQFATLTYSGAGQATSTIQSAGDGCTATTFSGFVAGNIAIVARGNCNFNVKSENAIAAGAVAAIVYNYEGEGIFTGTLGSPQSIPVLSTTFTIAQTWIGSTPAPTLSLVTDTSIQTTYTQNIIAETLFGSAETIIVVGSHLDSVSAGPGINDNGSGSSCNLEMAINFAFIQNNVNRVRFAWFGAEEEGLLGSEYYVSTLIESGDIKNVACNINFDMIGSPNFMRGVYDGSGASPEIQSGSLQIQGLFEEYFQFNNLNYTLTPFTGRSDYGPFIENGVPAGGLFSGAEEVKNMTGRSTFGGLANTPYDPCYHQVCDTVENINVPALDQLGRAAYFSLLNLANQNDILNWLGDPENIRGQKLPVPQPPSHPYLTKY